MNDKELKDSIEYLVRKYLTNRYDLIDLINEDTDSTKYILSQISNNKQREYDDKDKELVKDIAFYFI